MRKLTDDTTGSFIPVMLYLIGIVIFGFTYWMMDGILGFFKDANIADTTTYQVYPLLLLVWVAIIVIYVIFGGIWLIRTYNESNPYGGF